MQSLIERRVLSKWHIWHSTEYDKYTNRANTYKAFFRTLSIIDMIHYRPIVKYGNIVWRNACYTVYDELIIPEDLKLEELLLNN